jgi:hypothetical protein
MATQPATEGAANGNSGARGDHNSSFRNDVVAFIEGFIR